MKYFGKVLVVFALGVAAMVTPSVAQTQFPTNPINIVVGFDAGGGVDSFARTLALAAEDILGVPVAVVNRPGAASINAANQVAGSRADGYTLLLTNGPTLAAALALMGTEAVVDLDEDLVALGSVGVLNTALLVAADSPYQTASDLVEAARQNPGRLRWSHPGRGAFHMLAGAAFLEANGLTAQDVPFSGGGSARNALVGGQVDFSFGGIQLLGGFEEQIRALAVTSGERDPVFDHMPTYEEQGLPPADLSGPVSFYAPSGVPEDIVLILEQAIAEASTSEDYLTRAADAGLSVIYRSAEETNAAVEAIMLALNPIIETMIAER